MLKAEVTRIFRDKGTKETCRVGDTYKGPNQRLKDLQRKGFLTGVKEDKPEETILEQSVDDVKKELDGLGAEEFKHYLELEKNGKNRKSLIEYLESMIHVVEGGANDE